MPVENDIPTHLNIRIEPKLRYLAELAARASGKSLTGYVEEAIQESFKRVSIDEFPELSEEPEVRELTREERLAKFKKRSSTIANPLSDVADNLWSEHPFIRLQLLAVSGLDRLMSDEEKTVWEYLVTRKDLKNKYGKLDLKAISHQWPHIKDTALKAKAKGGK